jgi:NAD(P)-dependent dehydrogenase (short-subunit alcohol dehydrogenase family)
MQHHLSCCLLPRTVSRSIFSGELIRSSVCEFSYAQSKAGETQLTQLMAAALQPFKIRVNSICPGLFPSGLTLNAEGDYHKPMAEAHSNIPKG